MDVCIMPGPGPGPKNIKAQTHFLIKLKPLNPKKVNKQLNKIQKHRKEKAYESFNSKSAMNRPIYKKETRRT